MICIAAFAADAPTTAPAAQQPPAQQLIPQPGQAQVLAATDAARENLRQQILQISLARGVTVGDLVSRTGGDSALSAALQRARPLGGPRWLDPGTCQVKLVLPAAVVADVLYRQAEMHRDASPVSAGQLRYPLRHWNMMAFVAVGSCSGGDAVEWARPTAGSAWATVDDAARRRAIEAARADAAAHVLQTLEQLPPANPSAPPPLRSALADAALRQQLSRSLCQQPVTKVEFEDDLHVAVTIVPDAQTLAQEICHYPDTRRVADPSALAQQIESRVGPTVGQAAVMNASPMAPTSAPVLVSPPEPSLLLPAVPPPWADAQLQADATASGSDSTLKLMRSARTAALARLRAQVEALPLVGRTHLSDALSSDPAIAAAVDRALLQAQTVEVDYRANGTVQVRVALELHQLWNELNQPSP